MSGRGHVSGCGYEGRRGHMGGMGLSGCGCEDGWGHVGAIGCVWICPS